MHSDDQGTFIYSLNNSIQTQMILVTNNYITLRLNSLKVTESLPRKTKFSQSILARVKTLARMTVTTSLFLHLIFLMAKHKMNLTYMQALEDQPCFYVRILQGVKLIYNVNMKTKTKLSTGFAKTAINSCHSLIAFLMTIKVECFST